MRQGTDDSSRSRAATGHGSRVPGRPLAACPAFAIWWPDPLLRAVRW